MPERDHRALYEKLVLDGFQAGLSWRTILYKRDNFRRAFGGFEPATIARYTAADVEALMGDAGIVRSRAKIEATIGNAQAWLRIMDSRREGFAGWLWDFVDGRPVVNRRTAGAPPVASSPLSVALAKELKRQGFRFCGPVIVYAFMQAVGMVNDHELECPRWKAVQEMAT